MNHGVLGLQESRTNASIEACEYVEARFSAYYQVTTEFAAHKNVDRERAQSDLEEHQLVCISASK